jgi:predicted DNA-binding antitoxin AbrB/MazE fold protein
MSQRIDAIYDSGVLRPLEPLALPDQAWVKVTIEVQDASRSAQDAAVVSNSVLTGGREDNGQTDGTFERELDSLLFDGPSLPQDFARADIYADHD